MRILLVDDSNVFRHILSLYFQSSILNCEAVIDQAYDGEQALEKYYLVQKYSIEYNVIFLDCDRGRRHVTCHTLSMGIAKTHIETQELMF